MNKVEKAMIYVLTTLLLGVTLYMMLLIGIQSLTIFCILVVLNVVIIYNELFIVPYGNSEGTFLYVVVGVAMLLSMLMMAQITHVSVVLFQVILIAQIMRIYGRRQGLWWLGATLLGDGVVLGVIYKNPSIWLGMYIGNQLIGVVGTVIISLIYYIIEQNKALEQIQKELLLKEIYREDTYSKLQHAYKELESYTLLEERNRLARQMHDTVGHTLTTALVELESANLQLKEEDEVKLYIVQGIKRVRMGLYELRTTVRKLKENINWEIELEGLIARLKEHRNLQVYFRKDSLQDVNERLCQCLYHTIQEGVTNGLKHGDATAFVIDIRSEEDGIRLKIMDNGNGCSGFQKGFGLQAMEDRIGEVKGILEVESEVGQGFTIMAFFPNEGVKV